MARNKVISLKEGAPLSKQLKGSFRTVGRSQVLDLQSGTIVKMGDGWQGRVFHDDGKTVTIIKDGETINPAFKGHRGFVRSSAKIGGFRIVGRSQVVDLQARKMLNCTVTVMDRERLETEWQSAPGYN